MVLRAVVSILYTARYCFVYEIVDVVKGNVLYWQFAGRSNEQLDQGPVFW